MIKKRLKYSSNSLVVLDRKAQLAQRGDDEKEVTLMGENTSKNVDVQVLDYIVRSSSQN